MVFYLRGDATGCVPFTSLLLIKVERVPSEVSRACLQLIEHTRGSKISSRRDGVTNSGNSGKVQLVRIDGKARQSFLPSLVIISGQTRGNML